MYKYEISGYYFEYGGYHFDELDRLVVAERKHFDFEIEAPDNIIAMQIALGRIMLNTKNAVKLDVIHYECL